MPLPVAHGLVGASVVALWRARGSPSHDWPSLFKGAGLAVSPDLDFILVWVFHLSGSWHRGFTHSILMALIVTSLMLAALGRTQTRVAFAFGSAFLSHGLLDFLTTKRGGGVELLWPFSAERFKLGLISFSDFPAGFHVAEMLKWSGLECLVFTPVFVCVLLLRSYVLSSFRSAHDA